MIVLTILVCLTADPMSCKRVDLATDVGPVACVLHGQAAAAEWQAGHPKWRVERLTCGRREVRS